MDNPEKLNNLCSEVAVLKASHRLLKESCESMAEDISDIKKTLLGRPTWSVLIIISALATISTSLTIYIITNR